MTLTATKTKRDEFIDKLKTKIDDWNDEMTRLEAKAEAAGDAARQQFKERAETFRSKRKLVETQIQHIQSSADKSWSELEAGADQAWNELRQAFETAKSNLN